MNERLKAFIMLLRPPYWIMTGGLSVLAMVTMKKGLPDLYILAITFLSVISITSGGFAFNDYHDQKADAIVKPSRPIPSRRIAPWQALLTSAVLFAIGLIAALITNLLCFGIASMNVILLVAYSAFIKRLAGFLGNFLIGFLIGTSFVYGEAALFGGVTAVSFSLTFMSMGSIGGNMLRDVLSLDGDLKAGYTTVATKRGPSFTTKVGATLFLLNAVASPVPLLAGAVGYAYLIPIIIWDVILVYSAVVLLRKAETQEVKKQERLVTRTMLLIPIALVAGALT
ncbi:MAG: UbiA family prenyltransferase [Candidatus Bathyarchaeota archaeon]|nr:UbiA family prenyltransferase [Candidatus Bathyarchaeota archaeon]